MFNLWNTVTGANPSATSSSKYRDDIRFNLSFNDGKAVINEDEVVNELLSQFPTYGSKQAFDLDHDDYDEKDEDEDENGDNKEDEQEDDHDDGSQYNMISSCVNQDDFTGKNTSTSLNELDTFWDDDEKELWKLDEANKIYRQRFSFVASSPSSSTNTQNNNNITDHQKNDSNTNKFSHSMFYNSIRQKKIISDKNNIHHPNHEKNDNDRNKIPLNRFGNHNNEPKEYWMPDSLCKFCYLCEIQFTVFRRRHHCRLCGQVFCSNCSAFFVELAPNPPPQSISSTSSPLPSKQHNSQLNHQNEHLKLQNHQKQQKNKQNQRQPQKRTMRVCKVCFDQIHSSPSHAAMFGVDDTGYNQNNKTDGKRITTTVTGRWNDYDDDYSLHPLSKIESQSNITKLKQSTKDDDLDDVTNKMNNNPKSISLSSTSLNPKALNSSSSLLQSNTNARNNLNLTGKTSTNLSNASTCDHPKNNIPPSSSMTTGGENSFLNQYQNSYDESSFQALNLTKLKLQERAAAALKAAAVANGDETYVADIQALLDRRHHQQNSHTNNDHINDDLNGDNDDRMANASAETYKNNSPSNSNISSNSRFQQILDVKRNMQQKRGSGNTFNADRHQQQQPNFDNSHQPAPFKRILSSFVDRSNANKNAMVDTTNKVLLSKEGGPTILEEVEQNKNMKGNGLDPALKLKNLEHSFSRSSSSGNTHTHNDHNIANSKNISNDEISKTHPPPRSNNQKVGELAANHLEKMTKELLMSDAPLLLEEFKNEKWMNWVNVILMLITRACATVMPNIKGGDALDIRPYCKVKVIAGGLPSDCAYVSGVVFHKNVSHKRMAKEIMNPKIMLLSGGIEYTRSTNRIASISILLEQEQKYMEILVMKIIGLKPCVLLVGKSVNRQAQELLLNANIVLIQHVKSGLMNRIARQTGATILSSADHVITKFRTSVLGRCRRFRLVTFRDKEAWSDQCSKFQRVARARALSAKANYTPQPISVLLHHLPNHQRQTFLAANRLGEDVMDGTQAVKNGLAKRGIARNYIMLEGCPKRLGCTVVLRGASRAALKQVKRVFSFLLTVGYNLKLETSYYRERRACLPDNYVVSDEPLHNSSSLCVDYGKHPLGRKTRPWNGASTSKNGTDLSRSISGKITAFDHQSILITSVWMTDNIQCCPAEVKGICYYSLQDVSLGQFLRDSCFNLDLKCQNPSCKKSVLEHSLSFIHNDGRINITVEQMDDPLPPAPQQPTSNSDNLFSAKKSKENKSTSSSNEPELAPIATWTYCKQCCKVVTPLVYISDDTWQLSFGKFVEIYFYNKDFILHSPNQGCSCQMQSAAILYFGCGNLAARFTYESIQPYGVYVRRFLPFDEEFHVQDALVHLEKISNLSSSLFVKFDKHIERISREARQLFDSPVNKTEYLQTVLSELNVIGSEVDYAAKTLQEKIAAITDSRHEKYGGSDKRVGDWALLRLPWHARRYLALLTSVWNDRLSAVGQALTAMKKLDASYQTKASGGRGEMTVVGMNAAANAIVEGYGGTSDDVMEGMKRLRQLKELYAQYNVRDMDIRSYSKQITSRGNNRVHRHNSDYDYSEYDDDAQDDFENDMLDFTNNDLDTYMLDDGPDADALASRRRLNQKILDEGTIPLRPTKSLGTRRPLNKNDPIQQMTPQPGGFLSREPSFVSSTSSPHILKSYDHPLVTSTQETSKSKAVTPGGAVKSAITRFFNRGNKDSDAYIVDLGIFSEGSLRLEPGVNGMVLPVYDDQPSTVIAYSLGSEEYNKQFCKCLNLGEAKGYNDGISNDEPPSFDENFGHGKDSSTSRHKDSSRNTTRSNRNIPLTPQEQRKNIEQRMLVRSKAHIKHTFKELDLKGQQICKYICTTFWATQFAAVRQAFLSSNSDSNTDNPFDMEQNYIQSLSASQSWAASGGKSGASFSLTNDGRFVVKCISKTELQMFLDCAPAYFEYLSKAFFHGLPTILCKIVGVYQIGYNNRITGKRSMEQVTIMQNIFYGRKISITFDLKGTQRGRFAKLLSKDKKKSKVSFKSTENASDRDVDVEPHKMSSKKKSKNDYISDSTSDSETADSDSSSDESTEDDDISSNSSNGRSEKVSGNEGPTLLDGDFLEFTGGRPLPLNDRAKAIFHMSILNDTLFLSIINVLDYSILIGIDEEKKELVVGIIDFMRQYDILKQMERVGKSIPMVVGASLPTIIQPPLYKARFTNAMERYFMTVPNKWTTI